MHMTSERHGGGCGGYRDEILLLACGDVELSECSATTVEHLSHCSACSASLGEMRELTAFLASEFEAAPLEAGIELDIRRRLSRRRGSAGQVIGWSLRCAGFAVAAGLMLCFLIPLDGRPGGGPLRLTDEESAEVAIAYVSLEWSGPVELSIERVERSVAEIFRELEHDLDADSVLPWAREDDWDAAAEAGGEPSSRIEDRNSMKFHTL